MADPFEQFINVELPRRPVTLTFALTGWDAPPGDPGAPAILASAPLGTWFREKTAAKWWRKSETVWEESGSGPGPGGGNMLATKERMVWHIDPVLGQRPPAGTVFTTQAEYDAFGHPLKYMNDVEACRPYSVDHAIAVMLPAGHIPPDPTYLFGDGLYLSQLFSSRMALPDFYSPDPWYTIYPGIAVVGAQTEIEASVAGSITRDARTRQHTFTRTTGTWTPSALVGMVAEITSGPLAGTKSPIYYNDATTLKLAGDADPGAVTLRIYERATKIEGGMWMGGFVTNGYAVGNAMFAIVNCEFVSTGFQALSSQTAMVAYCKFNGFCRFDAGNMTLFGNEFYVDPTAFGGVDSYGPSKLYIFDNWFHGGAGGEILYLRDHVMGVIGQNYFEAGPGYAGYMFYFGESCMFESLTGVSYLKGNDSCYGILMWGNSHFAERGYLVVDHCVSAINIFNQLVGSIYVLAGCEGNGYLFGVEGHERQIIGVPIGLALSPTAYVALTSAGGDITLAMLTAEGVAAGDRWEQAGYVFQF